jgi:pimeloyl-ACP methyl ester carboxylesterase
MKARHLIVAWLVGLIFAASGTAARAAGYDVAIPLHNGKIELSDLSAEICRQMHLPAFPLGQGSIKVKGITGSLFVQSLNAALGEGCQVRVEGDHLLLHLDPAHLPQSVPQAEAAVRRMVAADFPGPTARQEKLFGLFMPKQFDANRPVVILVHGLDDGRYTMEPIGNALAADGYQVAYFVYPADGPIDEDAASLAKGLAKIQNANPQLKIDLVGYSMGGLVARRYVEGKEYAGGVEHLIEVGTPNHGSDWVWFEPILAAHENFELAKSKIGWSPTWMFTEGMGEAITDMAPGSKFLHRLNQLPRRPGVQYTIIVGDKNIFASMGAGLADGAAADVPGKNAISQFLRLGLRTAGANLDATTAPGDGPVTLHSAKLAGVTDFVVVHADHVALAYGASGQPPAALATIEDRLGR